MPALKKTNHPQTPLPSVDNTASIIRDLQTTIQKKDHLPHTSLCRCQMCLDGKYGDTISAKPDLPKSTSQDAIKVYRKILDGLTLSGSRSLKINIPDLFFVEGQCFEIFHTSKQGRIFKSPGMTPLKLLYPTIVRMRRQYKSQLQQNFNKKMIEKVNPNFLHQKYYDIIVPSYFPEGSPSPILELNKNTFRRYILHKNQKYIIASLEEHKMNEKQPFCLIVYTDGNCQLLNQVQFEMFTLQMQNRISSEILYFQSYIKYKRQAQSIIYSEYIYEYDFINVEVDKRAEQDIMILLGGLNKYDEGYRDLQTIEQIDLELMNEDPHKYVEVMIYKIVHYLAMASRINISKLKLKWIINDLGTVYLQEVMECIVSEVPKRAIRFRLPRKEEAVDFYGSTGNFVQIYREMKKRRKLNTLIIKKDIDNKTYEQLLDIMNPQMKNMYDDEKKQEEKNRQYVAVSRTKPLHQLSKTIDVNRPVIQKPKKSKILNSSTYEEHLRQNPEFALRNMRYNSINLSSVSPQRSRKLDKKINNHFRYKMSSQDRKIIGDYRYKNSSQPKSSFDSYFDKKRQRITDSVLYSTFSDLTREKAKQINKVIEQEKVSKKLMQSITKR